MVSLSFSTAGEGLIQAYYKEYRLLLKKNSTRSGIIACARSKRAVDRRYASIFGRDAAICAVWM